MNELIAQWGVTLQLRMLQEDSFTEESHGQQECHTCSKLADTVRCLPNHDRQIRSRTDGTGRMLTGLHWFAGRAVKHGLPLTPWQRAPPACLYFMLPGLG